MINCTKMVKEKDVENGWGRGFALGSLGIYELGETAHLSLSVTGTRCWIVSKRIPIEDVL